MSSECPSQASTGSPQFPKQTGLSPHACPMDSATSEVNWRKAQEDFDTTRSTPFWYPSKDSLAPSDCSVPPRTSSLLDPLLHETTAGKKTPEWKGANLNSDNSPCAAKLLRTGIKSTMMRNKETSIRSPVMYWFVATTNCVRSAMTIQNRWLNCESAVSTGELLVQANRAEHGMKQAWTVSLKILAPSGGMDTLISLTSSLMSSEAQSISRTCFAGLTGIRYVWKQKVNPCLCEHPRYGLHQTFVPPCGTPI